jgi:hypothetical protein
MCQAVAGVLDACLSLEWPRIDGDEPELSDLFSIDRAEVERLKANVSEKLGATRFYWMVFETPVDPAGSKPEPVIGDLVDDIEELYADLAPALSAWKQNPARFERAVLWDWRATPFEAHSAAHAASAVRALQVIVSDHLLG